MLFINGSVVVVVAEQPVVIFCSFPHLLQKDLLVFWDIAPVYYFYKIAKLTLTGFAVTKTTDLSCYTHQSLI